MVRHSFIAMAVVVSLYLAGCGGQPGASLVKFDNKSAPRLTEAPSAGVYQLYSELGVNPDVSYTLHTGDQLGFIQENGKTYAVAGAHKDALKSGTVYYWKMQDE